MLLSLSLPLDVKLGWKRVDGGEVVTSDWQERKLHSWHMSVRDL